MLLFVVEHDTHPNLGSLDADSHIVKICKNPKSPAVSALLIRFCAQKDLKEEKGFTVLSSTVDLQSNES